MPNIEDEILSLDERARIVEQRRKQWAADLFTHRLTAEATAAGADPQTAAAITTLESAIASLAPAKQRLDDAIAAKAAPAPPPVAK